MPTTYSDIVPVRRVAVGDCSGPLGSGFDALARSAYAALLRANWQESAAPPFLPVHDNGQTANKTIPSGDAWKCTYGYDAVARTERSACGAVAYSFELPPDAYSGTPADIATVSLSLTGDRYLDAGVDLYVYASSDATPIAVGSQPASALAGTYCATSGQAPTQPNDRHGVTSPVVVSLGTRAWRYLHVVLLLHDYTTNRGAWIEGGAMLDCGVADIEFSREVSSPTLTSTILRPIFAPTGSSGAQYLVRQCGVNIDKTDSVAAALGTIADGSAALAASQLCAPDDAPYGWSRIGFAQGSPWAGVIDSGSKYYLVCTSPVYDATDLRAGRAIALPLSGSSGLRVRADLVDLPSAAEEIDWSDASLLGGLSPRCLGEVEFVTQSGSTGTASLVLRRTPKTPLCALLLYPVACDSAPASYNPPAVLPVA